MKSDVIVLGAGAAGLMAAAELRQAGLSVTLIEARDRAGGRLLTIEDPEFSFPIDLGAEFVHGLPELTLSLAREFRLAIYEASDRHLFQDSGSLKELPDFWERIDQVLGKSARGRDRSLLESLNLRKIRGRNRKLALTFVEGFHAADPAKISEKAIVQETRSAGEMDGDRAYRIWGGYAALVEGLLLRAEGAQLALETEAQEVHWGAGEVEVRASRGQFFRARSLVTTLPPGPLARVRFEPELPSEKLGALQRIESGPVMKLVLLFKEPVWERKLGKDTSFVHSADERYFPTWWTTAPVRSSVLTGWTGGPAARELAGRDPNEAAEIAVKSLSRILGMRPQVLLSLTTRLFWHDWVSDPYSLGAYSYLSVGGLSAPGALARPLDSTLFFAGEATESSGVTGTVEGALQSGRRVAREITRMLGTERSAQAA